MIFLHPYIRLSECRSRSEGKSELRSGRSCFTEAPMTNKQLVLILCTGNSCRSQMAEAFLRKYQGDKYEVASAGTEPKPEVHPLAVKVMAEADIDISGARPKPLRDFL